MSDVDVIVFVLDGAQTIGRGDVFIAGELERVDTPVVGVVNKTDLLDEGKIVSQLEVARPPVPVRGDSAGVVEDGIECAGTRAPARGLPAAGPEVLPRRIR